MFVPFEEMPGYARVWIYQSDRELTSSEQDIIDEHVVKFLNDWAAHGSGLQSSGKIFHNRFLVLLVDEAQAQASGCSIDSSVHFVQSLESKLGVNFFDRTKVAFLSEGEVFLEPLVNIRNRTTNGKIYQDTLTFNNLVRDKNEMEEKWMVPVGETWLEEYF